MPPHDLRFRKFPELQKIFLSVIAAYNQALYCGVWCGVKRLPLCLEYYDVRRFVMDSAKSPAYFATRYKNNRCVLLSCLYIYKGRISSPTRLLYAEALYGVERFWFYIE